MTLQLTRDERDFLLEMLNATHAEMQHELHHTDTNEYREFLRRRLEMLERLVGRVTALQEA